MIRASGKDADVAQSMCVTAWNLGIAGGGIAGGLLLARFDSTILPWAAAGLGLVTVAIIFQARRHGFA